MVPGVTRVAATTGKDGFVGVEVDSERGHDVRRELAAVVVARGWGLLELRPMRMSLEDIFLSLTTEENAAGRLAEGGSAVGEETGSLPPPRDPADDQEVANA
jgi:ABC-2 type transport system ATP-binding protein